MAGYPITLTPEDNGTFLVTCDALPEVTIVAQTQAQAPLLAQRAVEEALAARIAAGEDIPPMQHAAGVGHGYATIRSLVQMKVALYQRLRDLGLSRADLARRLDWSRNSVDRLFQLDHQSRPDQLDAAFIALGSPSGIDAITSAQAGVEAGVQAGVQAA